MRVLLTAAGLTLLFYGRLFFGYTWTDQWDLAVQELPRFDFLARTLQQTGRFPLWDPHLWAGQPVLGMPQPGPLYPLNLVVYLWPLEGGHVSRTAFDVYYLLIHLQALLLTYLLCRELEAPPLGAWIGAVLYSFGGVMGTSPWPDHLNGVVWAPGLAWAVVRVYRRRHPWWAALAAGAMLGLAWLSGHHEAPFWLTVATGVALLPKWRELAVVAALTVLVAAPQVVPSVEFGQRARRFVETGRPLAWNERVPYEVHTRYSLQPAGLAGLVLPGQDPQAGNMMLTGLCGVVLALMGVRYTPIFTLVAAFGVIVALGAHTPFHGWLYEWVPMADKARVPVRAIFLTNLALAVLAATGAARLAPRWRWLALALAMLELANGSRERLVREDQASLVHWRSSHADLIAFLHQLPRPLRLMVDPAVLPFNLGDAEGLDQLYGMLPVVSANMEQHELHTPRVQDLFAVNYLVAGRGEGREIFRSKQGVGVFERASALPRAWFAPAVQRVANLDELRARLQAPGFDLKTVLTSGAARGVVGCGAKVIADRRSHPDEIRIEFVAPCESWLVVAEASDPGWSVRVDGQAMPVAEADEVLLGVRIPAGAREAVFGYKR